MTAEQSPAKRPGKQNDQIISYFTLRVMIGAAGILLPLFVFVGKYIDECSFRIEFSISDYYDNGSAGDILVGILFALAFFLFSYKGYDPVDNRAATTGAICALGVALFPTTSTHIAIHNMHFVFAFLLFSVFIFFSIYLFRKGAPGKAKTEKKEKRDVIYLVCGIIMIVCIIGIALFSIWLGKIASKYHLVFWFETIALASFGFSWITKAEFLFLKDPETEVKKVATGMKSEIEG